MNFANANFKSYNDGWLTDKGRVFIVLGNPNSTEKFSNFGNNVQYEKWIYNSFQREIIFEDKSGFGDFRLARPANFIEKYEYKK